MFHANFCDKFLLWKFGVYFYQFLCTYTLIVVLSFINGWCNRRRIAHRSRFVNIAFHSFSFRIYEMSWANGMKHTIRLLYVSTIKVFFYIVRQFLNITASLQTNLHLRLLFSKNYEL